MLTEVVGEQGSSSGEVRPFFSDLCNDCPVLLSIIGDELIREIEELENLSDEEVGVDLDVVFYRVWCDIYMKDKLPVDEWNVLFERRVQDNISGEIVLDWRVRRVVVSDEVKCPGLMFDKSN